jgi:hypothetical protein
MSENKAHTHKEEVPDNFAGAAALLKRLMESRGLRKEKLEERGTSIAIEILAKAATSETPENRLEAVSLLGKAGEISKPVATVVHAFLGRALDSALPTIGGWGNADDRYYLAKGISVSSALWIKQYAAEELARAEVVEKASRAVWADLAVNRSENLTEALENIGRALATQLNGLKDATDTAYRKLIRIAEALRQSLLTADVPTGQGFGKAFSKLVALAGGGRGAESLKLRDEAAVTILELLIQILRLRFEALFDSDLYRAAGTVRGWWRQARPTDEVETKTDRIASLAFSGLHVLARQGVADRELRQSLASALGQSRIDEIGKQLIAEDPSLDQEIAHWLATGHRLAETRSNESVRELNEQAADELLARLLLAVGDEDAGAQALKLVAETLEVFEPGQAAVLRSAAARSELITQWAKALAAKRGLSTYGNRGDSVQFDPAIHEGSGIMQRSSTVRIKSGGVIRELSGRSAVIVMKAVVEQQ